MKWTASEILAILDTCCAHSTFPMLDIGYVYLAGTRLSLYRSTDDWALVTEVFGFSPRERIPSTHISTFGSNLVNRKTAASYVNPAAFERYLAHNPHNESNFVYPVDEGDWQDADNAELLTSDPHGVLVRGNIVPTPSAYKYQVYGIVLEDPPHVHTFEFCRWLAAVARDEVLATSDERRTCVPLALEQIMQLEAWHHPNIVEEENRPSNNRTFMQLVEILVTGDLSLHRPTEEPNTHWSNWPDGGTL